MSSLRAVAATSNGAPARAAQQVVEELQGLPVGPVQVVGHQQQRRADARIAAVERVEQPLALLALGQRLAGRAPSSGSTARARPAARGRAARAAARGVRAQPRHDRPVGQLALGRVRARLRDGRAAMRAPRPQLLHQPGLPDPRLTADQDELRPAALAARHSSVSRVRSARARRAPRPEPAPRAPAPPAGAASRRARAWAREGSTPSSRPSAAAHAW